MVTPPTDPILDLLRPTATLREYRFRSQVPLIGSLIARFRELWNGVSTRWYVRPLIQQQSEFNEQIVALLATQATTLHTVESHRAQDEARQAYYEEQLARCEERLTACEVRLNNSEAHLGRQETRLHDHDGWLIAQDHEQSAAIADLNDTALRLIQTSRRLTDLEQRLAALEPESPSSAAQEAR
jgi:chromosome segregation ATPase